jgi:hypothetical protein
MDFKAQIEQARRQADSARQEHERATQALVDAVARLGILTGGYHGISALEGIAVDAVGATGGLDREATAGVDFARAPERGTNPRSGTRAKKGWGKRRADEIVRLHPDGISREEIGAFAAESADPIHDATLRNALRDLVGEGRIRQTGERYFPFEAAPEPAPRKAPADAGIAWDDQNG